nr:NADP-dependent oxidoreductase [Candidatus Eremiobacteraeota bacterium]
MPPRSPGERTSVRNCQVVLAARPDGIPQAQHFRIVESAVPRPGPGQFVVRNQFLGVEPAMRGWVSAVANYAEPVAIGAVMRSFAAGVVIESQHSGFAAGELVVGMFGWQDYAVSDGGGVRKVADDGVPLSAHLGVLGMNGITAYLALLDIGQPKAGETVVVSTAAGAVGSCAGQIAKLLGCRTVGITGGPEKAALCTDEFGYDAAIDYKATPDLDAAIKNVCPDGVDVYFDNTAGAISDAVMRHLAVRARIIVCGTASISSWVPWPAGPRVERHLLVKRARMQGFLLFDYAERFDEAIAQLTQWLREGKLRYREDVMHGIDAA